MWSDPLANPRGSATIDSMSDARKGLGCLVLFALPFAAAGVFLGILTVRMLWTWAETREWQEVPTRILHSELITNTDDDSTTYRVEARYSYEFAGVTFEGERVGLSTGSDNIGSFHEDKYQELSRYRSSGQPFRCYVDPAKPSRAILYRQLRWGLLALMGVFSCLFTGIGVGMIVAALVGRRRVQEAAELAADHPSEPWRWKPEWTDGRIAASGKNQFLLPAIMATFWNLVSTPLLFVIPTEVRDNGNHLALIGLVFPVVGLGLAVWAVRAFIRWQKFGDSVLELSPCPGIIGGPLAGRILTSVNLRPSKGFRLTLSCVNRVTSGSGKNRRTSESVLWQQEKHLQRQLAEFDPTRAEIPVDFQVPFDAAPTEEKSDDNEILWRLEVAAEVPGVDYNSQFEVPVFRTSESREVPAADEYIDSWGAVATPAVDLGEYGIDSELLSTGAHRLTFPAARHKGPAAMLTAFFLIWLGFDYLLVVLDAPLLFPIVWSLFSLLLLWGTLDLWFDQRTVEVHSDRMVLAGGIFGIGQIREIPRTEVAEIKAIRGMQSGNKLFYRIQITTRDDKKHIAATKLDNLSLAREVIERLG